MAGIVDKALRKNTGFQHPIKPRFSSDLALEKTGDVRPHTLDRNTEYVLSITLKQTFWANQAQLRDSEALARKALTATIYADVLQYLEPLLSAAYGGDMEETIRLATLVKKEISP